MLICGITTKRGREEQNEETPPAKKPRNERTIIDMLLHWNGKKHPVKVLLDTGCLVALLNQQTAEKLEVTLRRHPQPRRIENYTGETVANAGQIL